MIIIKTKKEYDLFENNLISPIQFFNNKWKMKNFKSKKYNNITNLKNIPKYDEYFVLVKGYLAFPLHCYSFKDILFLSNKKSETINFAKNVVNFICNENNKNKIIYQEWKSEQVFIPWNFYKKSDFKNNSFENKSILSDYSKISKQVIDYYACSPEDKLNWYTNSIIYCIYHIKNGVIQTK